MKLALEVAFRISNLVVVVKILCIVMESVCKVLISGTFHQLLNLPETLNI